MVAPSGRWEVEFIENLLAMKSIIFLLGLGLLMLVGPVGCEEEHEHGHYHGGYGGAYDGYNQGYGYQRWPDQYHHDND